MVLHHGNCSQRFNVTKYIYLSTVLAYNLKGLEFYLSISIYCYFVVWREMVLFTPLHLFYSFSYFADYKLYSLMECNSVHLLNYCSSVQLWGPSTALHLSDNFSYKLLYRLQYQFSIRAEVSLFKLIHCIDNQMKTWFWLFVTVHTYM